MAGSNQRRRGPRTRRFPASAWVGLLLLLLHLRSSLLPERIVPVHAAKRAFRRLERRSSNWRGSIPARRNRARSAGEIVCSEIEIGRTARLRRRSTLPPSDEVGAERLDVVRRQIKDGAGLMEDVGDTDSDRVVAGECPRQEFPLVNEVSLGGDEPVDAIANRQPIRFVSPFAAGLKSVALVEILLDSRGGVGPQSEVRELAANRLCSAADRVRKEREFTVRACSASRRPCCLTYSGSERERRVSTTETSGRLELGDLVFHVDLPGSVTVARLTLDQLV